MLHKAAEGRAGSGKGFGADERLALKALRERELREGGRLVGGLVRTRALERRVLLILALALDAVRALEAVGAVALFAR